MTEQYNPGGWQPSVAQSVESDVDAVKNKRLPESMSEWLIPGYSFFNPDKDLKAVYGAPEVGSEGATAGSQQNISASFVQDPPLDCNHQSETASPTDTAGDTGDAPPAEDGLLSPGFKLLPTLSRIFLRADLDNDKRLSKTELIKAINGCRLNNEEELICGLILHHFEDVRRGRIKSTRFFDNRGVSLEQVLSGLDWTRYLPIEAVQESPR